MGWQVDDFGSDHEGYPVAVLEDLSEPDPIQVPLTYGDGTAPNSSWWLYDGKEGRPRAVAVRAGCSCGWRATRVHPVNFEDQEETDGYEYTAGPYAAWDRQHIAYLLGATVPDDLTDAIETVRRMLDGLAVTRPLAAASAAADIEQLGTAALQRAVTRAKKTQSWAAIGDAIGTTRQAAHQRFAKAPFRG